MQNVTHGIQLSNHIVFLLSLQGCFFMKSNWSLFLCCFSWLFWSHWSFCLCSNAPISPHIFMDTTEMKKMKHNTIITHTDTVTAIDSTCKALTVATESDFVTHLTLKSLVVCCAYLKVFRFMHDRNVYL